MQTKSFGFTIIELVVVIVVIAILTTISIVIYNGVQDRARFTAMQSDLSNFSKLIELNTIGRGTYGTVSYDTSISDSVQRWNASNNSMANIVPDLKLTPGIYAEMPDVSRNFIYCISDNASDYAILVKLRNGGVYMKQSNDNEAKPVTVAWNGETTAGTLCANQGYTSSSSDRMNNASGYWQQPPYSNGWRKWTGLGEEM